VAPPARIRSDSAPITSDPTPSRWPELLLLIGFVVICLLSVLTVLVPSTENEKDDGKAAEAQPAAE
jgi:TRAP-type C4-dicarboxylate transport system permease small subunit